MVTILPVTGFHTGVESTEYIKRKKRKATVKVFSSAFAVTIITISDTMNLLEKLQVVGLIMLLLTIFSKLSLPPFYL